MSTKKMILSACLVAGTSIGAGLIALPMALCTLGILPTIALILVVWFLMYISGILSIELNLRAGRGLPLGKLAQLFSGPIASGIGVVSFILLIYALLCAYLYGGASIFQSFCSAHFGWTLDAQVISFVYACLLGLLFMTSVGFVLKINRYLFIILLVFFMLIVCGLLYKVEFSHLPLLSNTAVNLRSWTIALPILFTSYGFQVIFHTITNFCDKDPVILRRSIFWGSMVPAIVYILWIVGTLGVLYHYAPADYQQLLNGTLEVGKFIEALAQTTSFPVIQILASGISMVAIAKSSIGVGLGLFESWDEQLNKIHLNRSVLQKGLDIGLTLLPPLAFALFVPQLFLKALSFAGMVLVVIAILLPLWLIHRPKAKKIKPFYPIVENRIIQLICLGFGVLVILCELTNLFKGA